MFWREDDHRVTYVASGLPVFCLAIPFFPRRFLLLQRDLPPRQEVLLVPVSYLFLRRYFRPPFPTLFHPSFLLKVLYARKVHARFRKSRVFFVGIQSTVFFFGGKEQALASSRNPFLGFPPPMV